MDGKMHSVRGHERGWWVVIVAAFIALFLSQGHRLGTPAGWTASLGHAPAVVAVETSGDDDDGGEEIGRC